MITYTLNIAQYIILIALSIGTGYVLDEVIRALLRTVHFGIKSKRKSLFS